MEQTSQIHSCAILIDNISALPTCQSTMALYGIVCDPNIFAVCQKIISVYYRVDKWTKK